MGVFHLFMFQLRSWSHNLKLLDSEFILISDLIFLFLTLCFSICAFRSLGPQTVLGNVTSSKIRAVQDLAAFAIVQHPTHPLPMKPMSHQKSGFSQVEHLPTFQSSSMGPNNTRLYTLQHFLSPVLWLSIIVQV